MTDAITAKLVLLDIEGTIGAISFVAGVLFPYARQRLEAYVEAHGAAPEVGQILADTRAEVPGQEPVTTLLDWHDRDIKAGPLKRLQGLIWEEGFRSGAFTAHLYADAFTAFDRWRAAGIDLAVYSSGSIKAQQLYFEHTEKGDIRSLFKGFFDTTSGAKTEANSYLRIAEALGTAPADILFLSDSPRELEAAKGAGFVVLHVIREGTGADARFASVQSLDAISLDRT
jgi:enolase-phosphatase E1